LEAEKFFTTAREGYQRILSKDNPQRLVVMNGLAWLLATAPESSKSRDPVRAVELAKQVVAAAPQDGNCWNTFGVAQYRAGDFKAAISALEKAIEIRKGGDSFDWFFLAMAHENLGHRDQARQWYDKAVVWMEHNQKLNSELRRFRTEAVALLGIKDEPEPKPK
jgi:tetratricopeptide (TPR) repeat protein